MGELPLSKKPEKGAIVVQEIRYGMMEEAFRGRGSIRRSCWAPARKRCFLYPPSRVTGKSFIAGDGTVWPIWVRKLSLQFGYPQARANKLFNPSHRTGKVLQLSGLPRAYQSF